MRLRLGWLLVLASTGCAPVAPPLVSSAYVQAVSRDAAVVCQLARHGDACALEYGPPGGPTRRVAEAAPTTHHRFEVRGLEPDTTYGYRLVSSSGVPIQEASFRTAPLPGRRAVRLLVASDTGEDPQRYQGVKPVDEVGEALGIDGHGGSATAALVESFGEHRPERPQVHTVRTMLRTDPDAELLLHCGDLIGPDRKRGDYREAYLEPFAPLMDHVPVFPAIGNHDLQTAGGTPWAELFVTPGSDATTTRRWYSFDWGDLHAVTLDTGSSLAPGSPQRAFLTEDLARSSGAAWTVVITHVGPFSEVKGDGAALERDLVPLLEEGGVDLLLSGHDHCYQRFAPRNGVTYVTLPSGGQWYPRRAAPSPRLAATALGYGFARIVADAARLTLEGVDAGTGLRFDSVTLERSGP